VLRVREAHQTLLVCPGDPRPEPPRGRTGGHKLAEAVVSFGLPLIYLTLLTVTELTKRPEISVLYGPLAVGALGALICLLTRPRVGRAIVAVISCAWWCLLAGVTMVAIDILIFPF
jgi:hypothetical protein